MSFDPSIKAIIVKISPARLISHNFFIRLSVVKLRSTNESVAGIANSHNFDTSVMPLPVINI